MSDAWLETMSHEECVELLRAHSVGRIAFVSDGAPIVLPVNYRIVEAHGTTPATWIALRTRPGNVIDRAPLAVALQVSAYSLKALAVAALPLMGPGGSIVGLDFDNTVAWPAYNWMGVAKSAFESVSRYIARDLGAQGIRVNLVCAGPVRTMAAKSIPGFDSFEEVWDQRAPLGWDVKDPEPAARACVALLSDWFPATTGEMLHVDGGVHAVGA